MKGWWSRRWQGVVRVGQGLRRADPILQLGLVAALTRAIGIVRHYHGSDLLGQPIAPEPGRFTHWALPYHIGLFIALGALGTAIASLWPRSRRAVFALLGLLLGFAIFFGQVDLEMLRGLGQHLTLGFLRQHFGSAMFGDIADGMERDLGHLVGSGLVVVGGWVGLVLVWRDARRRGPPTPTPLWRWAATPATGAILIAFPHVYHWSPNRLSVIIPPEVLLLRDAIVGVATPAPADEAAAAKALRAHLGPEADPDAWLGPELPLVHRPSAPPRTAPAQPPDVFMIVVESLRGREVAPGTDAATYPNLARFAARSVAFPYFISNGFPSAQGFFSLTCSGWAHPRAYMTGDFVSQRFDCLPLRLRTLGYQTAFFAGSNPQMDNQLPWVRRMYDVTQFDDAHGYDRKVVDGFLGWLGARDADREARPLFAWVSTISTHFPFEPADPELGPAPMEDLYPRYLRSLAYADGQLGRLFEALEHRTRPAVIVVVGDHSFPVDEPGGRDRSGEPCDRYVWTAAYIHAPPELMGAPRVLTFPASQVDVMPTILRMVGDARPTATLGRDLLDGDARDRVAIATTLGGVRIDLDAVSVFTSPGGEVQWAERRREENQCVGTQELTPELAARVQAALQDVNLWAWLVENDRVWDPKFLGSGP